MIRQHFSALSRAKINPVPVYETTIVNGIAEETLVGHQPGPRPPQDTRAAVKLVMFRLAIGFTILAMALSIAAIGELFSLFVPALVAYAVAAVFDGLWIYALLGEWMSQTHPKARRASQIAGLFFMAASMGAIIVTGVLHHMIAVGIVAALVPLGVKAAWWLRLETTTHRLPRAYQLRLERERDQVHTALALEIENRELDAARALTAELRALRAPADITVEQLMAPAISPVATATPDATVPALAPRISDEQVERLLAVLQRQPAGEAPHAADATQDEADALLDDGPPLEPPTLASLPKAEAIRIALDKRPTYEPAEISNLLDGYGVTVTEAYVRQVRDRDTKKA
jgi:hypothetical protein